MLKKLLTAGLVVTAFALNAPAVSAGHETVECEVVGTPVATSQSGFTANVAGTVVGQPTEAVSIECEFRVNGVTQAVTPTGSGTGTATTSGTLSFTAGPTDVVDLCAAYVTASHGPGMVCTTVTFTSGPNAWCAGASWSDGDSCTFEAPFGAFAFGGTASVSSGIAFVYVEVVFNNVVVASCSNAAPLTATCTGQATSVSGTMHDCRVYGSGGPYFQCADPPRLPVA
jgi:hypothetical protein